MKKVILSLLLILAGAMKCYGQSFSTTFPATENPISQSGQWINGGTTGLDWGNVQTTTNKAFGVSLPAPFADPTAILTGTWNSTQTASATVFVIGSPAPVAHEVELRLRSTISAHVNNGYEINCSVTTASPYIQVVRWNGALGNFTQLDQNGSIACVNGDVLQATITGAANNTQIQVRRNGTLVTFSNCNCTTVVDTAGITTGNPGIGFYDNQDVNWLNFGFSQFSATGGPAGPTCSQTDVQTAINNAAAGQTVNIPAGNCQWTAGWNAATSSAIPAVTLNKAITLKGAGKGVTNITLAPSPSATKVTGHIFEITKQSTTLTRIQDMSFSVSNLKPVDGSKAVMLGGPWPTTSQGAVVLYNLGITLSGADFMQMGTAGGVIFSNITFRGKLGDTLYAAKQNQAPPNSWTTVGSTLGSLDTTGLYNSYVEDSNFFGGNLNDCDDNCRTVVRYNVFDMSTGFNSHGEDTSPYGMRQFEIYHNSFGQSIRPTANCSLGDNNLANMNQMLWIRGGTGVVYTNQWAPISSPSCWGTKANWKLNNRGAEDARPQGSCGSTSYPVPHQIGQGNNGSSDILDPIWFWDNTSSDTSIKPHGFFIEANSGWAWNNPCGFDWNTFFQWGRDAINTTVGSPVLPSGGGSVEGQGGTPKPGYTPFTHPHPLVAPTSSPSLSISPSPVPFGTVNVGSTSTAQTVTVTNTGSATQTWTTPFFTITGTNASDFVRTGGTIANAGTLAAGASGTIILTMTPSAQGPRAAVLNLNGTATASVNLSGTGQSTISIPSVPTGLAAAVSGPNVTLTWTASTGTPTSYQCKSGPNGGPYTTFSTVTTTNCSQGPLSNNTYFYVVAACNSAGCSANSAQASAVVFTAPAATVLPTSLSSWQPQPLIVGQASVAQTVTITNTGTATLVVSSVSVTGTYAPDFVQTNSCGSIAISASCPVSIVFTPSSTVNETATLVIVSNDPNSPDTVALSGTGIISNVIITPSSIAFGNINPHKGSTTQTITFQNLSGFTITFSSVALSGGDTSQFALSGNTCSGSKANGISCSVNVTFAPTALGVCTNNQCSSSVVFTYTGATGSPKSVPITGTASKRNIVKVGAGVSWPYSSGVTVMKTVLRPWKREERIPDKL